MITLETLNEALDYESYNKLLQDLLLQGKTTGLNQSAEYLNYTKINLQRMHRLEKTIQIQPELIKHLAGLKHNYIWLVITEGWCGDAAQILPILNMIGQVNPNITLKLILRDEHPTIMNQYLSNGTRSIPKLICIHKDTMQELFVWGPRPKELQLRVKSLLEKGMSKEEKGIFTQKWYNNDAGKSVQLELLELATSYMT